MSQFADFVTLQFQISGALTTASILEYPLPFPAEVVSVSANLGVANTGADLLVNLSKNGVAVLAPAAIASIAFAGNVNTVTTSAAHGFIPNQTVVISSATTAANNGTFVVTSVPSPTTFNVTNAAGVAQGGAGGSVNLNGQSRIVFPNGAAAVTTFSTAQASSVANGTNWAQPSGNVPSGVALATYAAGDRIGLKVDQVGSTIAGSTLTATVLCIKK